MEKQIEALKVKNSLESTKQSYKDVEKLLSENCNEAITFKSLQFSIMATNDSNQAIVDAIIEGKNDSKKGNLWCTENLAHW